MEKVSSTTGPIPFNRSATMSRNVVAEVSIFCANEGSSTAVAPSVVVVVEGGGGPGTGRE